MHESAGRSPFDALGRSVRSLGYAGAALGLVLVLDLDVVGGFLVGDCGIAVLVYVSGLGLVRLVGLSRLRLVYVSGLLVGFGGLVRPVEGVGYRVFVRRLHRRNLAVVIAAAP